MANQNKTLGNFRLDGIPAAPRGVPQIEVTFDIDANGILNVNAKDKATGKEQSVKITASTNLASDEVDRLVREAKDHESEDQKARDLVEARNSADQLIYGTESALTELGDKVPATDRGQIEQLVEDLRQAKEGSDVDRIKQLMEQLQQASHALTQQIYQQQEGAAGPDMDGAADAGSTPGEGETDGEDDVVEGEYRQV
jgi:molecular chaperone DnaK